MGSFLCKCFCKRNDSNTLYHKKYLEQLTITDIKKCIIIWREIRTELYLDEDYQQLIKICKIIEQYSEELKLREAQIEQSDENKNNK